MSGRNYDEALRRALHAAVESVEPSSDGLERIRARLGRPPLLSSATAASWYSETSLRVAGWAEPLLGAIADALRKAVDRFRPPAPRPGHARPRFGWLRPVAAMATFIFVVAAGAAAAMTIPQAISSSSSATNQMHQPGQQPGAGSGQQGATNGDSSPVPSGSGTHAYTHPSHSSSSPAAKRCHVAGSSPPSSTSPVTTTTSPTTTTTSPTTTTTSPTTTTTTPTTTTTDTPPTQSGSSRTSSPGTAEQQSGLPQSSPQSATQARALQPSVGTSDSSSSSDPLTSPAPYQQSPCPSTSAATSKASTAGTKHSLGGVLDPVTTSGHGRVPPADRARKNS